MKSAGTVLLLDDERALLSSLERYLMKKGYKVRPFDDGEEAIKHLQNREDVDVAISDIRMPAMDGMEFLTRLREMPTSPPVIMMTAFGTIKNAVDAMKAGAYDYLTKPFEVDELLLVIERAMELVSLRKEVQKLRLEMERRFSINGLAAKSKIMKSILSTISRLSPEKTPTLFTGDSGTGKLFLSKVMHRSGNRSDRPFELVACSAIAASAQRTQIFGDAETDGMIQKAEGGILFLDDLDALSPECQQMLLQYLETGEFMQDQAEVPTQADVRIVAAILGNDEEIIKGQALHPDLYFKFSPFMIQLPSLQDRREDIPVLAQSFLEEFCKQNAVALKTLSPESMKILQNYSWPGNVRELQNVIERAVILSAGEKIGIDELPSAMTQLTNLGATKLPTNYSLEELEKAYIYQVLQDNNNHQGKTAQSLGIDRKTLWRKIRSYYPDAAQK